MLVPKFIELFLHLILCLEVVNLVFVLEEVDASFLSIFLCQNFGVLVSLAGGGILLDGVVVEVIIVSLLRRLSEIIALENPELGVLNISLGDCDTIFGGR